MNLELLAGLEARLQQRIRGQDHILPRVCSVLQRGELGLNASGRPKGSFLLLGPTGVGKTETVLAFSEILFGTGHVHRLDMSEFQHADQIKNFIGDESGYQGRLGNILRLTQTGTLLFDEIEKAHRVILDIFLQILDIGRVTTGQGTAYDLSGFYIAATSNIGGPDVMRMSGLPLSSIRRIVLDILHEEMRPELIARFQEKLVFQKLSPLVQRQIAADALESELCRLRSQGHEVKPSPEALEYIVRNGVDKWHGARPLRATIEKSVGDAVLDCLLRGRKAEGILAVDPSRRCLRIKNGVTSQH